MWKGLWAKRIPMGTSGSTIRAGGAGTRRESLDGRWEVWRQLYKPEKVVDERNL